MNTKDFLSSPQAGYIPKTIVKKNNSSKKNIKSTNRTTKK